jgi:hypothetical protein
MPKVFVIGKTIGITRKILADAEPINNCKNNIRAYIKSIVINLLLPISKLKTKYITVSIIPLSSITSLTEDAIAIIIRQAT